MSTTPLISFINFAVSLMPVLAFLIALVVLDSYKLVRFLSVLLALVAGFLAAVVSYLADGGVLIYTGIDPNLFRRYVGPLIEELAKSLYLVYLIRSKRVGFMVDAAILGFAVGAGFALVENVYYLQQLDEQNPILWIIRGFGTAIMHGGATAIFAVIFKNVSDRGGSGLLGGFLPGYFIASAVHSFYNHFFFNPAVSTMLIIVLLPVVMTVVFRRSETSLRHWLGVGFDSDQELLEMLTSGRLMETHVGRYLQSLQEKFRPEALVDMICYLRIRVELSIEAKGILLMRQSGFDVPPGPDVKERFTELRELERNIGQTGKIALLPFLHKSDRELWQLYMLEEN